MLTISRRTLGSLLSGAALAGWLAGSTLNPPVASTQVAPATVARPAVSAPDLPRVDWPTVPRIARRPVPSRNPFAFRGNDRQSAESAPPSPVVASAGTEGAALEASGATSAAAIPPAAPAWHFSGVATSANGALVAILAGGGDVQLAAEGDVLPGGDRVVALTADRVTLDTSAGPVVLHLK